MSSLELVALMHVHALSRRWDQAAPGDWTDLLASFPLFAGISKRRLRKLARNATLAEFAPGETIVFAGDAGQVLDIILSGRVKTSMGNGRMLRVGDYFGEIGLIDDHPRSATVAAMSHVQVMRLPSRSALELARQHSTIKVPVPVVLGAGPMHKRPQLSPSFASLCAAPHPPHSSAPRSHRGLPFFAPLWDPRAEIHIWSPLSPPKRLAEAIARYVSPPLFPVSIAEIPASVTFHELLARTWRLGSTQVSASRVTHRGPTVGYRIEEAGQSLAYIPDHEPYFAVEPDDVVPDRLSGYGVARDASLVHDAQYLEAEYPL